MGSVLTGMATIRPSMQAVKDETNINWPFLIKTLQIGGGVARRPFLTQPAAADCTSSSLAAMATSALALGGDGGLSILICSSKSIKTFCPGEFMVMASNLVSSPSHLLLPLRSRIKVAHY